MAKEWKDIADVPVNAWFRFKVRPDEMFRISDIRLQYIPMGLGPAAVGQAVNIGGTHWRVEELIAVFEFSFEPADKTAWYPCEGEMPDLGSVDKLGAYIERELRRHQELSGNSLAEIEKQLAAFKSQTDAINALNEDLKKLRDAVSALQSTASANETKQAEAKTPAKGSTPPK